MMFVCAVEMNLAFHQRDVGIGKIFAEGSKNGWSSITLVKREIFRSGPNLSAIVKKTVSR